MSPKVNLLDVDECTTYADICMETWQVIKFFLDKSKLINTENLEPKDRKCQICAELFIIGVHRAVRLPCNH